eukprot:TRINITY_DN14861_c0_g1_i1.p1 TRINITY_DN14861_c0_g1~~TRINITY_DN14861_c0_g1_i1.p1  ORF type:complete len:212 (-),score=73.24 TRINITY_DN14861_c0_g1_i1:219-854(-)
MGVRSPSIGSGVNPPLSLLPKSLPRRKEEEDYEEEEEAEDGETLSGNHALVIHSSSGISSGSSDGGAEDDALGGGGEGDSSVAGDESTICSPSICSNDTLKTNLSSNRSAQRLNRHSKLRSKQALPFISGKPGSSGVIEHDISTIRKDAEITSLKSQIDQLKSEISSSQKTMFKLQDNEKRLKDNLREEREKSMTYEKIITKNTPKGNFSE